MLLELSCGRAGSRKESQLAQQMRRILRFGLSRFTPEGNRSPGAAGGAVLSPYGWVDSWSKETILTLRMRAGAEPGGVTVEKKLIPWLPAEG